MALHATCHPRVPLPLRPLSQATNLMWATALLDLCDPALWRALLRQLAAVGVS